MSTLPAPAPALLDAALAYAARGWPVFPLRPKGKGPLIASSLGGAGYRDATCDPGQIRFWWSRHPQANIGIACGAVSGLVVLDQDLYKPEAEPQLVAWETEHEPLPPTRMVLTGGGGLHLWHRHPGGIVPSRPLAPGIDIKGDGGYIVAPPSRHPSGSVYRWLGDPEHVLAPLPDWLLVRCQRAPDRSRAIAEPPRPLHHPRPTGSTAKWVGRALERVRDGAYRNGTGLWLACQLRDDGIGEEEARTALLTYGEQVHAGSQPYSPREALASLRSAYQRPSRPPARSTASLSTLAVAPAPAARLAPVPAEPAPDDDQECAHSCAQDPDDGDVPTPAPEVTPMVTLVTGVPSAELVQGEADDNGNALAMLALFGREMLYTPAYGWLRWTGTHWRAVPEAVITRLAITALTLRRHAAIKAQNEAIIRATRANRSRVQGCVGLFQSYVLEADVSAFDADPDLLNVANGVYNLASGTLTPHSPEQRFTYCVPVAYSPTADMSPWVTFLQGALGEDEATLRYFQMCVGYSLTGHTREEKLFYLYGPPRAGKGTITETLLALLPHPISTEADFASFTAKRDNDSQNFDLAELKPARLVIASESNRYQALNPAKIKSLTGGNHVRCAFKHRDMFTYRPQFKVWLVSNHEVLADADDDALWARVQVFPCPRSFVGVEDVHLKARMRSPAVLTGVLRWSIEGASAYYAAGRLVAPQAITDATTAQRGAQDYIRLWIEDCCALDARYWTASGTLLENYHDWCERNGAKPVRPSELSLALTRRFGCTPHREAHTGRRGFDGIGLVSRQGDT